MKKVILVLLPILWANVTFAGDVYLKNFGQAPLYNGVDQEGHNYSSALLAGKISVVNFFFTSCEGPCPILMAKIKLILDKTKSCKNVQAVSISVDPDTDSPDILKSYSETRGYTAPNWSLLRIEKDKVIDLINNGFHLGQGESIVSHTTRVAVVDQYGTIRALVGGMDEDAIERLSGGILELCK